MPVPAIVAVALTLGSALGPQGSLSELDSLMEAATASLQAGRASESERLFRQVVDQYPFLPAAHQGLADALIAQGKVDEGVAVLVGSGIRLQRAGWTSDAMETLSAVVAIAPENKPARYFLGAAMMDASDYESAVDQFRALLALGDTQLATRLSLASSLWEAGQLADSESEFRTAARVTGNNPLVLHQLGTLLLWQGRFSEAREVLERAVGGADETSALVTDLARALAGDGDSVAAVEAARRAVALDPANTRARYLLASLLSRVGEGEAAARELEEFHRLTRQERERTYATARMRASLDRANELLSRGDAAGAAAAFQELPESVESLEGLATASTMLGKHEEAAAALERALALQPERRDLQLSLARARLAARRQR